MVKRVLDYNRFDEYIRKEIKELEEKYLKDKFGAHNEAIEAKRQAKLAARKLKRRSKS